MITNRLPWLKNLITGLLIAAIIGTVFIAYGCIDNKFYKVLVITSDSMSPVLKTGDLIIITPANDLKVGDIATFVVDGKLVTHRVVATEPAIRTKGDSNNAEDSWVVDSVGGIYRFKIPLIGYPMAAVSGVFRNMIGRSSALMRDTESAPVNIGAGTW